jgi:hypothetical protein
VARGDWATVEGHLATLAADERPGYAAMAALAARLAGRELPPGLGEGVQAEAQVAPAAAVDPGGGATP